MIGKNPVLGVDLGEHSAKYVLVSTLRKELVIEHFGVVDLKDLQKIRATLNAKGVKSIRTVAGITGQSVFLRFVRLPPVPKKQMDQIVRYEAQQQVPFPIEEVRWDYQVLSAASQDERDVVLVAAKNEIVQDVVRSLIEAGLRPDFLDVSVLSLYNCLLFNQTIHPGTSSMILDIGAKTTHMIVADRGSLWARNIPIAGNHVTQAISEDMGIPFEEAERVKTSLDSGQTKIPQAQAAMDKVFARLIAEVGRSLGFYRSQFPNAVVNDIFLCGSGALLHGVDKGLKERFNLPTKRLDSAAGFKISADINAAELSRSKIFLGGALGLALRGLTECRMRIDLVPHEWRRAKDLKKKIAFVSGAFAMLALAGIFQWAFSSHLASDQDARTAVLDSSYQDMKALSLKVEECQVDLQLLKAKFQCVEDQLLAAQMWPSVLRAVGDVLPKNFWLVRIAGERMQSLAAEPGMAGLLTLEGKTSGDIDQDLPRFREALSKIPLFSDVEIASAQVDKGIVEFTLKLKVKVPMLIENSQ